MRRRAFATLVAAVACALAACGGASDQQQVRSKIRQFAAAMGGRNYQALCDQIFAPALVSQLDSLGLPCEQQLRQSLAPVRKPTVEIKRVVLRGKAATANVVSDAAGETRSSDVIGLVKTKAGWRIASRADAAREARKRRRAALRASAARRSRGPAPPTASRRRLRRRAPVVR
jgi:hypothetical protein